MKSARAIPFWAIALSLGMIGYTATMINEHQIHLKEEHYSKIMNKNKMN